jgi:Family of unknown function (DUF5752)/Bacterial regulatory protein, arsR family
MDFSPIKREILEALLFHNQTPTKAAQIAKETGKPTPAVQMHLIGLVRMGYATSPVKGNYTVSEEGKKALGLSEVSREKAYAILAPTPFEKAFHFYVDIGKPLNLYARDLREFCDRVSQVNVESVQFHFNRGDFESWFSSLGDEELTKRIALLKNRNLAGEELQEQIRKTIESRYKTLSKIAGNGSPADMS